MALAAAALVGLQATALTFDAAGAKNHPISRVVKLLNDMKVQLEKEADADQETYENLRAGARRMTRARPSLSRMERHVSPTWPTPSRR
jgi:hypothetical protein